MSREYFNVWLKIYKCNYKKNNNCNKKNCNYICKSKDYCSYTDEWKYAKRTPLNYIKKIINNIRGI